MTALSEKAKEIADEAPLVVVPPPEPLTQLRAPFRPESIGKLPRVTCQSCSRISGRCCSDHNKAKCAECGNYMTTQHIHLDYVGHAEVTDRLLTVDPKWSWEPLAFDIDGMPRFVRNEHGQPVGLWIKLTVAGVTRLGFGSVESNKFDAEKQLIGDALRNAAMRFGVALTLWAKSELESEVDETSAAQIQPAPVDPAADEAMQALADVIKSIADEGERLDLVAHLRRTFGESKRMTPSQIEAATAIAAGWPDTKPPHSAEPNEGASF